jgi:hypothetical protein
VSVALVIQLAKNMHYIVICVLSGSTIFFNIISQTARFSGKNIEHEIVFLFYVQHFTETLLILRIINQDNIRNVHWSSCKIPDILARF